MTAKTPAASSVSSRTLTVLPTRNGLTKATIELAVCPTVAVMGTVSNCVGACPCPLHLNSHVPAAGSVRMTSASSVSASELGQYSTANCALANGGKSTCAGETEKLRGLELPATSTTSSPVGLSTDSIVDVREPTSHTISGTSAAGDAVADRLRPYQNSPRVSLTKWTLPSSPDASRSGLYNNSYVCVLPPAATRREAPSKPCPLRTTSKSAESSSGLVRKICTTTASRTRHDTSSVSSAGGLSTRISTVNHVYCPLGAVKVSDPLMVPLFCGLNVSSYMLDLPAPTVSVSFPETYGKSEKILYLHVSPPRMFGTLRVRATDLRACDSSTRWPSARGSSAMPLSSYVLVSLVCAMVSCKDPL
mmetsp:Transcript_16901/g.55306  ORF Transcript_16901/g.55306 Transcript_16901/m.55306 type:complete len:362 (+) Transcript_16901:973-2058(+)